MFSGQNLVLAFIFLTAISACVIALLIHARQAARSSRKLRLSTLLLAFWIIGTIILTPYTFAIRIPGLPDLSIERLSFFGLLFASIVRIYTKDLTRPENSYIECIMLAFSTMCIISMARFGFVESYHAFPRPSFVFMIGYAIPFFTFAYTKRFVGEYDALVVMKFLFWFGGYLVIISFMEHFGYRDSVIPSYIADTQLSTLHLDRSRGPFLNAAFNGLALNITFMCGVMALQTIKGLRRWPYYLFLILHVPAIYFTRTRSVYVHFVMTAFVLMFVYRSRIARWKFIPGLVLIMGIVFIAKWDNLTSGDRVSGGLGQMKEVAIRLELAEKSLRLLMDNPFGGIGLAQFSTGSLFTPEEIELQHNHLIGMAVELGLPGAALYIMILLLVFHRLYKLCETVPESDFVNLNLVLLLATTLFVNLVNNFFVEPSLHMFTAVNFFFFAGVTDSLYEKYCLRFKRHAPVV